jgi:predicted transcriptional regulator
VTLFVAAVLLTGDVATLVHNALGGELTVRFLLKVAAVALIAGGTFGYFLTEIRKEETT